MSLVPDYPFGMDLSRRPTVSRIVYLDGHTQKLIDHGLGPRWFCSCPEFNQITPNTPLPPQPENRFISRTHAPDDVIALTRSNQAFIRLAGADQFKC